MTIRYAPPRQPGTSRPDTPRRGHAVYATQLNVGILLLTSVVAFSLLAPVLAPADPLAQQLDAIYQPPDRQHLLGTDDVGRDVFSRILYGGRELFAVAATATLIAAVLGLVLGLATGLGPRWFDIAVSRIAEIQLAIPSILLALVILSIDSGSQLALLAVLISSGWVLTFRIVRGHTKQVLGKPYIEAARLNGAGPLMIVHIHLSRSVLPLFAVSTTITAAGIAALATNLGFLGLGVHPPQPEWGQMVADGQATLGQSPWASLAPGAVLVITLVSLQLIGDGLASRWDRGRTAAEYEQDPS
ncbi:MAG: ABC transporter permease [Gordonia sp. (in: high G+C Gram-positive bacteria)]